MSDTVISVENLSKSYVIGHQRNRHDGLRHQVEAAFRNPWQWLKNRNQDKAKEREEFWALKNVSFEIKQGEVVGIIGRNGAGKSTLLKILSRITEPTSGRIRIKGRVASLLEVGTGFHPELTGRENIFLNGAILGMSRVEIKRKFDEIVAFSEIEKFLDTPVKRYSSGMYVRLAFAVAAHLEPEILIVDEVLAVGDAEFQKKCIGKMQDVSRGGRTVLFVSHNMPAIRQLCDSGVVLEGGKIKYLGNAADALETYNGVVKMGSEAAFAPNPDRPSITTVKIDDSALATGHLQIEIGFHSPFRLNPPVPGIAIHSISGIPVFASNPRFHKDGYEPRSVQEGSVCFTSEKLPLCGGRYHLSVWLGDWHEDYDHRANVLSFEFKNGETSANRPNSELIGYLDCGGLWQITENSQTTTNE